MKKQLIVLVLIITFVSTCISITFHTVVSIDQMKRSLIKEYSFSTNQLKSRLILENDQNKSVDTTQLKHHLLLIHNIEAFLVKDSSETTVSHYNVNELQGALLNFHENSVPFVFSEDALFIFEPVIKERELIYSIALKVSTRELNDKIYDSITTGIILFLVLMILSYLLVSIIQNVISGPINKLAEATKRISRSGDFSIRVENNGNKEVSALYKSFNEMIQQIQIKEWERDEAEIALRFSEERFRGAFEHASLGMALIGLNGEFLQVNSELCEMLGYTSPELLERNIYDFYPVSQVDANKNEFKEMIANTEKKNRVEKQFIKKNGALLHTIFSYLLHKDAEETPQYFVVQITNISARKSAEEQIQKLNEELEVRVEERTKELIKLNKELGKSLHNLNQTQEQLVQSEKMAALGSLVAGVAHEINTPIGIAVTAASYLEDRTNITYKQFFNENLTKQEFDEYIRTAQESTQMILSNMTRASGLIKSFKKVAVDQTMDELREFNLKSYIDDTLLSLKPQLKRTQIDIDVECSPLIMMNSYPGEISQILTNLIMNSIIHGFPEQPKKGDVEIVVTENEDAIEFTYIDSGVGISEENISRVFDPFFTTSRSKGGSGLGMHLIYNIITHKLNGLIQLLSPPMSGVNFRIVIPIKTDKKQKK